MGVLDRPREITVKSKDIGPAGVKSPGLYAQDTHTGAVLAVPKPVRRNGIYVEGREAAEHVASLLLLAQGNSGMRPGWDRSTETTEVFTVFGA